MHRSAVGFTLIEILIAVMLMGIGMIAVMGLVLRGVKTAQQTSNWVISAPIAHAAVDFAVGKGLLAVGTTRVAVLPDAAKQFQSPFAIKLDIIDHANASSLSWGVPSSVSQSQSTVSGSLTANLGRNAACWVRIRLYESTEDRDANPEREPLATYHLVKLIRGL